MNRRKVLRLSGATLGAAIAGCVNTGGGQAQQQDGDPIEFETPEALLLTPEMLPGDGWEELERGEADLLDVEVSFVREFADGEEVDGDEGTNWLVSSAVGPRETEADATDLYAELEADWTATVGDARVMDLELASEAAIAGYDGLSAAIFRDVNCVASVGFTDCGDASGNCHSDVGRVEELARTKRSSWRDGEADAADGAATETEPADSEDEFVDEIDEQVTLAYGEMAALSNGVETTVYEGTVYDQMGAEVPADRDRFLVVPVESQNTSEEPRRIPDQTGSWEVLYGDQQLGNVFNIGALEAEGYESFEGGEVQGGVHREGVLLFEVHDGFSAAEIDVLWQDSIFVAGDLDGNIDVRWSMGD